MDTVLLLLVFFSVSFKCIRPLSALFRQNHFCTAAWKWYFFMFFSNTTIQAKKNAVKPMKFFSICFVILVLHLAHCIKICSGLLPPSQNAGRYCRKSKITSSVYQELQLVPEVLIIHGQVRCTFFLGSFLLKLKQSLSPGICTVKCLEMN